MGDLFSSLFLSPHRVDPEIPLGPRQSQDADTLIAPLLQKTTHSALLFSTSPEGEPDSSTDPGAVTGFDRPLAPSHEVLISPHHGHEAETKPSEPPLFGTDGIRGLFGQGPLAPLRLYGLGQAIGRWTAKSLGISHGELPILIAWDTRASCHPLGHFLCQGLDSVGANFKRLGLFPTPALSCLVPLMGAPLGLMISASHNPCPYNGVKFINAQGGKLSAAQRESLTRDVHAAWNQNQSPESFHDAASERSSASHNPCPYNGVKFINAQGGKLSAAQRESQPRQHHAVAHEPYWTDTKASQAYQSFLKAQIPDLSGLSVVLDSAHGALFRHAQEVFSSCGAKILEHVGARPNGENINQGCGAVHPMALSRAMMRTQAHVGFTFDGDGDRVMVGTADGDIHDGDQIAACLAHCIPSPGVVGTLISNGALEDYYAKAQRLFFRCPVGDAEIAAALKEKNWNLGAEPSGHVLLPHLLATGDGVLVALHIAAFVKHHGNPFPIFTPMPSHTLNFAWDPSWSLDVTNDVVAQCTRPIEAQGRVVMRFSGTESNILRLTLQHPCPHTLSQAVKTLEAHIQRQGVKI